MLNKLRSFKLCSRAKAIFFYFEGSITIKFAIIRTRLLANNCLQIEQIVLGLLPFTLSARSFPLISLVCLSIHLSSMY